MWKETNKQKKKIYHCTERGGENKKSRKQERDHQGQREKVPMVPELVCPAACGRANVSQRIHRSPQRTPHDSRWKELQPVENPQWSRAECSWQDRSPLKTPHWNRFSWCGLHPMKSPHQSRIFFTCRTAAHGESPCWSRGRAREGRRSREKLLCRDHTPQQTPLPLTMQLQGVEESGVKE